MLSRCRPRCRFLFALSLRFVRKKKIGRQRGEVLVTAVFALLARKLARKASKNPQTKPRRGSPVIFFLAVCFFFVFLPHEMAGNITFSRGSFDSHFAECQEFSNL